MSKIGKKEIQIPEGVEVAFDEKNRIFTAKYNNETLEQKIGKEVKVEIDTGAKLINVSIENDNYKNFWGLYRTLINNVLIDIKDSYKKVLELHGVGYKAAINGKELVLSVGYSHDVKITLPEDISVEVSENTTINISGIRREYVGNFAAKVRAVRPPEPYKGKGIRYKDEVIIRKEVNTGASA